MQITTQGLDVDWKEAFFVLAVLVTGNEIYEAQQYVQNIMRRPTMRAIDPPSAPSLPSTGTYSRPAPEILSTNSAGN